MTKAEIRALIRPNETGICYVEGMSAKLVADPEYLPDMEDGPDSRWFCFEEPWVESCMILSKDCGFTATQILEARDLSDREEAEDAREDRPWGEQQSQVDWLESRFDETPMGDDFGG
jgi:hypothetical protein